MPTDVKTTKNEKDNSTSKKQTQNTQRITSVFSRNKDKPNITKPKGKKEE